MYYTNRTDNVYLSNGTLKIVGKLESYGGHPFTSGKIESVDAWLYGKFTIRSRMVGTARGTWPALWMMPRDRVYGNWPMSGEIDIMEHLGFESGKFHGSIHTEAYNHRLGTHSKNSIWKSANGWHEWVVEWRPNIMLFAVDGQVYHVFRKQSNDSAVWPFDQTFYIIINLAIGGDWGGSQGIDNNAFAGDGQIVEVDWVKVEQRT